MSTDFDLKVSQPKNKILENFAKAESNELNIGDFHFLMAILRVSNHSKYMVEYSNSTWTLALCDRSIYFLSIRFSIVNHIPCKKYHVDRPGIYDFYIIRVATLVV